MADDGVTHKASEDGRVASHPAHPTNPLRVAPTTEAEFNTFSLPLPAVACLQMADILFEFDSSFVLPDAREILQSLPELRLAHQNKRGDLPPVGVFGHADPVGSDEYNKLLSGRRATAVYGLLTHDLPKWQLLLNSPMGGDNWRAKGALATIRRFLNTPGPASEATLIKAYIQALFPDALAKSAFLAQGKDPRGKGDFQGCSRFNPLVILSQDQDHSLPVEQRNRENRPNRRVVIFLFRPGSKVDSALWPCPNAEEPSKGCKDQFFVTPPPGDQRRRPGAARREHATLADTTEDTFACAFYDEISHLSPCEKPVPPLQCCRHRGVVLDNQDPERMGRLRVRVPDLLGDQAVLAMPSVPYAGPNIGFYFLPPVGASVWVEFEAGDTERPIWSGCFWEAGETPPQALDPEPKFIKTEAAALTIANSAQIGGFTVQLDSGARLALDAAGAQLANGAAIIHMAGDKVSFNNGELEVA